MTIAHRIRKKLFSGLVFLHFTHDVVVVVESGRAVVGNGLGEDVEVGMGLRGEQGEKTTGRRKVELKEEEEEEERKRKMDDDDDE